MTDEATSGVDARNIVAKLLHGRGLTAGHIETYDAADAIIASLRQPPPASPSPAPAAVEELVARLGDEAQGLHSAAWSRTDGGQSLTMAAMLLEEAATALSTLAADKARIEAERDGWKANCQVQLEETHRNMRAKAAAEARASALEAALEWYGEQARLARLIHSEGDAGRHALAEDGGKRARAALSPAKETP